MSAALSDPLARLAKACRRDISDPTFRQAWTLVQQQDKTLSVDDLTNPEDFRQAVEMIRPLLSWVPGEPEARHRAPRTRTTWFEHAQVLSDEAVRRAREDQDVCAFREHVLGGQLLSQQEVPDWIGAQVGRPTTIENMVVFQDAGQIARAPATPGSHLDRLRRLARRLTRDNNWPEDAATVFVLTDASPWRWPMTVDTIHRDRGPLRIVLQVDAWMPAEAVREAYNNARRHLTKRADGPSLRVSRRISERRRALVAFMEERVQPGVAIRWRDAWKAWNAKYPSWMYSDLSNFRRDYARTAPRLEV